MIYCRPYAPEEKGKLERWHRTLRNQFLTALPPHKIYAIDELNSLLWAFIDQLYHPAPHSALAGQSPLSVWQNDLELITPLGTLAHQLDELFYHRVKRKVRQDGTISYAGKLFEVPYVLSRKTVIVVIEPHGQNALYVENEDGQRLGDITPLNLKANRHYQRAQSGQTTQPRPIAHSLAELALEQQQAQLSRPPRTRQKK